MPKKPRILRRTDGRVDNDYSLRSIRNLRRLLEAHLAGRSTLRRSGGSGPHARWYCRVCDAWFESDTDHAASVEDKVGELCAYLKSIDDSLSRRGVLPEPWKQPEPEPEPARKSSKGMLEWD